MSALPDQRFTFWFPHPHEIVATRDTTIRAPVYLDKAIQACTQAGSSVTIRDESYNVVVNAAAVTVDGNDIATYTVPANTFTSEQISELVYVEWTLVLSGTTYVVDNDGIICARLLWPVITDADLIQRVSSLDSTATNAITSKTNHQDKIDAAWHDIMSDLISDGVRPTWLRSPSSLRRAHVELTLHHIFQDESSRLNMAYRDLAKDYMDSYRREYKKLTALIDRDDDGQVDHAGRKGVAPSSIWLGD